jgi:hypothetical protein
MTIENTEQNPEGQSEEQLKTPEQKLIEENPDLFLNNLHQVDLQMRIYHLRRDVWKLGEIPSLSKFLNFPACDSAFYNGVSGSFMSFVKKAGLDKPKCARIYYKFATEGKYLSADGYMFFENLAEVEGAVQYIMDEEGNILFNFGQSDPDSDGKFHSLRQIKASLVRKLEWIEKIPR